MFLNTDYAKEFKPRTKVTDKVGKNQVSILVDAIEQHPTKLQGPHYQKRIFWDIMTKILNDEGPCERDAESWRTV